MYEVYLSTPLGARLTVLDRFASLTWTRRLNDVGALTIAFAPEQVDWRLWALDRRVEVWRTAPIPKVAGIYYLRNTERTTEANGKQSVVWRGEDANGLLDRRIIAYYAGTAQASKYDYADDMLKEFVLENLGTSAGDGRRLTDYVTFTIDAEHHAAPVTTKDCSRQRLLSVLQDVAQTSRELGTRLYFAIVHPTMTTLEFRTYVNRVGSDRTSSLSPFSLERGTLSAPVTVSEDHTGEYNYVYAAGQGTEEDREIIAVSDGPATTASPFARREGTADGRNYETTAALTAYGQKALDEWTARTTFEGTLQDIDGARYQIDWDFGDLVKAQMGEQTFNCEVDAVQGTVTPDSESITARLVSYE